MTQAIRKYRRDFVAILVLILLGMVVGGYILSNQRFYLPGWVPGVGSDFFELKAEMSTAQSVTPGQGQTVNIAGVEVGEISKVELKDGRAVIGMRIRPKYSGIHRDATILLRPKTGLNDMIAELSPGSPGTPRLKEGATIPIRQTLPNVNPDEILASLDRDTRDYLRLLLGSGAEGLRGQGPALSATFRRFEPVGRDLKKITGRLSERRRNLARVIHNFRLLSEELGTRDDQLAELVDSSNAVFSSFARQETNLRQSIALLPGALDETRGALDKTDTLARQLGPALQRLRPGARALAPALRATRPFVRRTTPIIRDQIRPFTRAALPTVRALRPAARDLADITPDLTRTFRVVNALLNTLAYNPPGDAEEGYLFWASWANHAGNSIFSTADAHGAIRRGLFLTSCASLGILQNVAEANDQLKTLVDLLNAPAQSQVCPQSAQAGGGANPRR